MLFVGIDVSKATLDIATSEGDAWQVANAPAACDALAERLSDATLVVLEATGRYEAPCAAALAAAGLPVAVVRGRRQPEAGPRLRPRDWATRQDRRCRRGRAGGLRRARPPGAAPATRGRRAGRAVFYGKRGRADQRDFRRLSSTASCLTLILSSVVYWQVREIERVVGEADGEPDAPDFGLLQHVSPVQWDNVTLYGAYHVRPELVRARPGLR